MPSGSRVRCRWSRTWLQAFGCRQGVQLEDGRPVAAGDAVLQSPADRRSERAFQNRVRAPQVRHAITQGQDLRRPVLCLKRLQLRKVGGLVEKGDQKPARVVGHVEEWVLRDDGGELGGGHYGHAGGDAGRFEQRLLDPCWTDGPLGREHHVAAVEEGADVGEAEALEEGAQVGHGDALGLADVDAAEEGDVGGGHGRVPGRSRLPYESAAVSRNRYPTPRTVSINSPDPS